MNLRTYAKGLFAGAIACVAAASCGDDGTIGSTLLEDEVQIIVDSSFTVTGSSVPMTNVQPRTLAELVGNISIPNFGSVSSNVVAQFVPVVALDTANFTAADIDSAFINFTYYPGGFIGDSIVPMGITVYPLTRQLPAELNTTFDPTGYYNADNYLATAVYSPSTLDKPDQSALSVRTVALRLPMEFARGLFNSFIANPQNYASGQIFTRNVFPGIYVDGTFGSGRLMQFERTSITMNFTQYQKNEATGKTDTTVVEQEYYAVAPEVINNNNISLRLDESLKARIDAGEAMMVAPAGYNARLRFPAPEVMASYRAHGGLIAVLNAVTLEIPADTIATGGLAPAPTYALMVLEKDLPEFFAQNKLPDDKTSFYATYNSTTRSYTFSALGTYISSLLERETAPTEEDYTFCIVPVTINFELDMTSYYQQKYIVSEVIPYVSGPSVAVLDLAKAKVKLTYSKQVSL